MSDTDQLVQIVNKQVANWTVLYMKLHNFHWYVKGQNFFALHEKFEELYNEADSHIDELAERILALEGNPIATLKDALEIASIGEAEGNEDANQMIHSLIDDFSILLTELKEGIKVANNMGDDSTGDMLITIHQGLEKHNWMLKAYLGK
ncbi:Dps family protein [Lederbergia wuyishanensis]|uniref:Starvation-inducible DNA-binding protein n=1 Tax=Lederbergia wuyishanensis TaxID=1347903 RepID=A0ABU0D4V0_9BACI|nr:Dps family protein [Lederbergia wuyishanensis]MCJ8009506.1 DNA starvation/stationary phase protection protein [Lederbergia wuyishanensis]MDQ0343411.1 starvation-inducible DNA-binding protein [Lederbergia wuyishanensis]